MVLGVIIIIALAMLYMLAYHSDSSAEPWKKPAILAMTFLVFLVFFFIIHEMGYQNGQRDASWGVHRGSPAKSYWQDKQVVIYPEAVVYGPGIRPWRN